MPDFTTRESWTDWCRQRVTVVMILMAAAFVLLAVRLVHLQVFQGETLRRMSENNAIRLQTLDPARGLIMDINRKILADNRPRFDIFVVPRDARPRDAVLPLLATLLDMKNSDIAKKLEKRPPFNPVLVKEDVGRDCLGVLEAHRYELPGVEVHVNLQRHFPEKGATAHLVGYLSEISLAEMKSGHYPNRKPGDFIGKFGIERELEKYLAGKPGGRQVEADARGRVVRVLKTVPPVSGRNVVLTLDVRLQKKAGDMLGGRPGSVVAMDPRTGRVLVMVSSPSYDPNMFVDGMSREQWEALSNDVNRPLRNKAIQAEYPPGSTYKMITAMAGLEERAITRDTETFCPGRLPFGDRYYLCWKHFGHGGMRVVEAIAQSCDVFFYKVGLEVGVDNLAKYATGCGLGKPTGVGLQNESPGLVPSSEWKRRVFGEPWYKGETLSVAIGQGANKATPMQMARFTAAIANGGTLYEPLLVDRVETTEGKVVETFQPRAQGKLPVSPENLRIIKEGMWGAVNGPKGTARGICPAELEISGKTGTAQVVGRKDNEKFLNQTSDNLFFQDHAWFVAFAPRENSEIAVAVMIEHGAHGTAAAPVARDLIQAYYDTKAEHE